MLLKSKDQIDCDPKYRDKMVFLPNNNYKFTILNNYFCIIHVIYKMLYYNFVEFVKIYSLYFFYCNLFGERKKKKKKRRET